MSEWNYTQLTKRHAFHYNDTVKGDAFKTKIPSRKSIGSADKFSLRYQFRFPVFDSLSLDWRDLFLMIAEWVLSPRLCPPQRRPVIRGDSIFPVHSLDYRLNSHYYKVTNEPRKCPADHPISLSLSLPHSFLSLNLFYPFALLLSILLRFSRFTYRSMVNGPNRFSSKLIIAN